jgi:hypothetical protein
MQHRHETTHLKHFRLGRDVNPVDAVPFVSMCTRLFRLDIHGDPIAYLGSLPTTVREFCQLSRSYQDRFGNIECIPERIEQLRFSACNFLLRFPPNLTTLTIGFQGVSVGPMCTIQTDFPPTLLELRIFDEINFPNPIKFPNALQKFAFRTGVRCPYSHSFRNLPESLVHLDLESEFEFQDVRFPQSLETLKWTNSKQQPDIAQLPRNLLYLSIFTKHLLNLSDFPKQLRMLKLRIRQDMDNIKPGMLPKSLRSFHLSARTRIGADVLPAKLENLAFGFQACYPVLGNLPPTFRRLTVLSDVDFEKPFPDDLQVLSLGFIKSTYCVPTKLLRLQVSTSEHRSYYKQPGVVHENVVFETDFLCAKNARSF